MADLFDGIENAEGGNLPALPALTAISTPAVLTFGNPLDDPAFPRELAEQDDPAARAVMEALPAETKAVIAAKVADAFAAVIPNMPEGVPVTLDIPGLPDNIIVQAARGFDGENMGGGQTAPPGPHTLDVWVLFVDLDACGNKELFKDDFLRRFSSAYSYEQDALDAAEKYGVDPKTIIRRVNTLFPDEQVHLNTHLEIQNTLLLWGQPGPEIKGELVIKGEVKAGNLLSLDVSRLDPPPLAGEIIKCAWGAADAADDPDPFTLPNSTGMEFTVPKEIIGRFLCAGIQRDGFAGCRFVYADAPVEEAD
jgi:hypothetical protein